MDSQKKPWNRKFRKPLFMIHTSLFIFKFKGTLPDSSTAGGQKMALFRGRYPA